MRFWTMVVGVTLLCGPARAAELQELGPAPDFTLPTHDGGEVSLEDVLGQGPVVVDFWATWCGPCKKALPRYQILYDRYKDQGLTILAVSQDDPRSLSKIGSFFRAQKLEFPALLDSDKKVGRQFGVQSLPTTIVIRADGEVMAIHRGYRDGDERVLEREIQALLASPATSGDEPSQGGR